MTRPDRNESRHERDAMADFLGACTPEDMGPCPDENVVAAFAEARLLPEEREAVEHHLARCEGCFAIVDALLDVASDSSDTPPAQHERAGTLRVVRARRAAVAAGVLVAAGAIWWVASRSSSAPPDVDRALVAQVERLALAVPEHFRAFKTLDEAERVSATPSTTRGTQVTLLHPRGSILEIRPAFRWRAPPGVSDIGIQVLSAEMSVVWERRVDASPWGYPEDVAALVPGRTYLCRLSFATAFTERESVLGEFTVATIAARTAFVAASAEIEARVPETLRDLVLAHFAIRMGFLAEAEAAARIYLAKNPGCLVARQTLRHVLVKLDSPEARELDEESSKKEDRR